MNTSTPTAPISPLFSLLLLFLGSQKHAPDTKNTFHAEYDYIIVGAGSAGSVVASRLSELSCVNVLLLEAGPPPPILTEIPIFAGFHELSNISWSYITTPQKHTAAAFRNKQVPIPAGKTLGGSSILNGMLVSRGNPSNYDEWAEMGATGWSYKEVLPYFLKLEDTQDIEYLQNAPDYHGVGGPMTLSKPHYEPEIKQPIVQAALDLGFELVDANGPTQHGFYDQQTTTRNGQRCSTAKAYLVPSENRPNLDILAEAFATKVVFDGKRARGVEFDFAGASHYVKASREVILSAGSVGSAKLLMLSGIGPRQDLEKLKIPVIADLPVGQNLQDHFGNYVAYEMGPSVLPIMSKATKDENIQEYLSRKSGPLTSPWGVALLAFLSNSNPSNSQSQPDHFLAFIEAGFKFAEMRGVTKEIYEQVFKEHENKTVVFCLSELLHPKSKGSVSLQSNDPYAPPIIEPNYYEHQSDITDVVEGLKHCRKIMSSAHLSKLGAKELPLTYPGCENIEDEQSFLECTTRNMIISSSHLSGTAKMGDPGDPTTVVDPQLRLKKVSGLRVIDASVMPNVVWGNTNIPTIMIGEKASDIIKETVSCHRREEIRAMEL